MKSGHNPNTPRFYDRLYNGIWEMNGRSRPWPYEDHERKRFYFRLARLPYFNFRGKILDVGCGMGGLLASLPVRGAQRKYGVDFSRVGIDKCRRRIKGSFHIGDLHDLPYPDAAFERVMCVETLEHVNNPARVVAEMERVLNPRGKLLVTVPEQSRDTPDDHWPEGVSLHVRKFSAASLRALIERSALRVESLTLDERTIWLVAEKAVEGYRRANRRRKKNKREPKIV